MNKQDIFSLIRLFLAPVLVMVLGLILLVNPDSASALIAKLLGWILVAIGIGIGISAAVTKRGQTGKGIAAVILVVFGGWLASHPLMLATWIGRLIGILLVIDGLQDIMNARAQGKRFVMPLIVTVIGAVLILMPMTTSRIVFSLCGLVVLVIGIAMFLDRLKDRRQLPPSEDSNIVDAL